MKNQRHVDFIDDFKDAQLAIFFLRVYVNELVYVPAPPANLVDLK